jgi:hypothetical protein
MGVIPTLLGQATALMNLKHRAEKWMPVFRKAMRKQKSRASGAIPISRRWL